MNIGKKWSVDEETRLLDELASGMTILEISNLHGRTPGAISSRQRHMAANFYRDGMSVKEIMERCRMTQQGLIVTLRNRGLDVLKIKNSFLPNKMDRLAKVNEALKYVGNIPQNKWDYGKMHEMHENNIKEAMKRLDAHKTQVSELEAKCRLRGVDEAEIQKSVHRSFSHNHIQLLEQVIAAKKALTMMDIGTVEELTRQKIAILEEMALETTTA
jgi:predicted transcriptional regulator